MKQKSHKTQTGFWQNRRVHIIILILTTTFAFINTLPNDFTLVDDWGGFVTSEIVKDFWRSIASLNLQTVLYTISYHLFGLSAIPLHILSMSLHTANTVMFYLIFSLLFTPPVGFIAALLFGIHPVVTEAVVWISGLPYPLSTFFLTLTVYYFIQYRKTDQKKYLYWSVGICSSALLAYQSVWLITLPAVLLIIDQFFLNDEINIRSAVKLWVYLIPIGIFIIYTFAFLITPRTATHAGAEPFHQQTLTPIFEGIPYTIGTMSWLYLFPVKLMIYYDGNPITPLYYYLMFSATAAYAALTVVLWKYSRVFAGILLMLIISMAPTMSPIKLVWFLSERYLYHGTAYFCLGIALILTLVLHKKNATKLIGISILMILFGAYMLRTQLRILDYRSSETLARATIRTSPLGLRGHDDLANSYLINGNYISAAPIYYHALSLVPDANTPISNLGLIFLTFELPGTTYPPPPRDPRSPDELIRASAEFMNKNMITNAAYYAYQALQKAPEDPRPYELFGDAFVRVQSFQKAESYYQKALTLSRSPDTRLYNKLAYTASWQGNYPKAQEYLQQALALKPDDEETLINLQKLAELRMQNTQTGTIQPAGPLPVKSSDR